MRFCPALRLVLGWIRTGKIDPPPEAGNPEIRGKRGRGHPESRSTILQGGAAWLAVGALALELWSCGLSDIGDQGQGDLPRSEAVILFEPGLEGTVQIDSLSWLPALVPLGEAITATELEGVFRARFTSLAPRPIQLRYDLRFYDRDGFLVDAFIPFGQPVRLAPAEVRTVEGGFRLQASTAADLGRIATMRLYATVADTSG
jgi:hypothetical protein